MPFSQPSASLCDDSLSPNLAFPGAFMLLFVPSQKGPFRSLVTATRWLCAVSAVVSCPRVFVFIVSRRGHPVPTFILWNKQHTLGRGKGGTAKPRRVKRLGQNIPEVVPAPRDAAVHAGGRARPGHSRAGLGFVFAEPRLRGSAKAFSLFLLFSFLNEGARPPKMFLSPSSEAEKPPAPLAVS